MEMMLAICTIYTTCIVIVLWEISSTLKKIKNELERQNKSL